MSTVVRHQRGASIVYSAYHPCTYAQRDVMSRFPRWASSWIAIGDLRGIEARYFGKTRDFDGFLSLMPADKTLRSNVVNGCEIISYLHSAGRIDGVISGKARGPIRRAKLKRDVQWQERARASKGMIKLLRRADRREWIACELRGFFPARHIEDYCLNGGRMEYVFIRIGNIYF